jgi:hypothetical protein
MEGSRRRKPAPKKPKTLWLDQDTIEKIGSLSSRDDQEWLADEMRRAVKAVVDRFFEGRAPE